MTRYSDRFKADVKKTTSWISAGVLALSLCASYYGFNNNHNKIYAGEMLGQTNFDDGVGLPWHTCESETGKMDYEISGGKYKITIVNPGGSSNGGEDRWDCQFRHRGLKIVAGHSYEISYEITASKAGQYYTKIGNLDGDVEVWHSNTNEGDFGSNWGLIQIGANETKKVKMTFTTSQSLDVAEWAFHLGGDGQYTNGGCFQPGTVITFDNMSLVDKTSDENDYKAEESVETAGINANQLGYFPSSAKKATLLSDSSDAVDFDLCSSDGDVVYSGKTTPMGHDNDSDNDVHIIDFTDFDEEGDGYYLQAGESKSHPFSISKQIYSNMLYDSLNYFYQNRSGEEILSEYISSGDKDKLARAAGHKPDNAKTDLVWGYSDSYSLDVTGGWYDAGDHGKYVVNGGISLWTMQNQYERAIHVKDANPDLYGDGALNIPESGNDIPDILDESRIELEWMMSMMVPDNYKYAGMVHHKVHDIKWTGLGLAPADDTMERILKPPTTAATLNFAACAAQGYRIWKEYDCDFADKCLENAEKAYKAAKKNPEMYAPLTETQGGGGAYGDNNVSDEFYWAASELYLATEKSDYYDDLKKSDNYLKISTSLSGGEDVDSVGSLDWGNVSALGNMSIALLQNGFSDDEIKKLTESFSDASDFYIDLEDSQGYGIPLKTSTVGAIKGYPWGSNSFVVNSAIIMSYAYDLTGDQKHFDGAVSAMDYIMGRNPLDYSYVTGYGTNFIKNPHHRFWANQINSDFPCAPSGVLCGGPNSGLEDPWVKGLGLSAGDKAPQLCYVDHIESWSTNECTINWNAPLAWMAGYMTTDSERKVSVSEKSDDDEAKVTKKQEEKTEKTQTAKKSDNKSSKSTGDNEEKGIIEKVKDILALVGAGVIGLLTLIGFISVIRGIIKLIKKSSGGK